jgi:hypothetical protein
LNTLNNGTITTRITNNLMDSSTGDGFVANANTGTITLNQFTVNTLTNSGGNGILFNATNNGTINIPTSEDINGNFTLDESEDVNGNGFLDLGMFMNDVSNSVGNGFSVTGTGSNFHLGRVSDLISNRSTSGQGGIVINVTDSVLSGQFVGNTLIGGANNTTLGPGFSLTATGGTFDVSVGGPNEADRNTIRNNAGAGIAILAQNAAIGSFRIDNNFVSGTLNGREDVNGNGILDISEDRNGNGRLDVGEDANGNGVLDLGEDRNGNGILDVGNTALGGEGIHIGTGAFATFGQATASILDSSITGNILTGNVSHGLGVDVREESTLRNLTISGNTINSNFGDGISFVRRDNAVVENTRILQNIIDFNGEDLNLNGVLDTGEDLNGNQQLDGDGIRIAGFEGGRTILTFDVQENQITRNFLSGIHMNVAADARLNVNITHNLIDNNGTNLTAALANFATGNGILTTENFGAATDKREIGGQWTANRITKNAARGIRLDGTVTNIFNEIADTFTANNLLIGGNLIDSNGLDGILVNGPGRMTIDNNTITNNGTSAALEAAVTSATAQGSDLGNGIAIRSVLLDQNGNIAAQTLPPESVNTPGSALEPRAAGPKFVEVLRNEIRGNANDGIEIRHANNPSGLHDAELHPGFFPLSVVVQANVIDLNRGRGVDILNQGGSRSPENVDLNTTETGASTAVNPPDSTVTRTSNQFSPTDSTVRLIDNRVSSNDKEGIYVVNTASLTQDQIGNTPVPGNSEDPTRGLTTAAANSDSVPRLALDVEHNLIIKNGQRLDIDPATGAAIDTITSGGLVIRVGTADATVVQEESPFLQNGVAFVDFASAPGGTTEPLFGETGYRNADAILQSSGLNFGQLGFFNRLQPGGVVAKVTNNGLNSLGQRDTSTGFEGNFGSDVYIESFTSALAAIARLDMVFENNSGDSLDVTNFGAFIGAAGNRQNGQRLAGSTPLSGVVQAGTGDSAFRVSGATVTAQVAMGINVNTNQFTSKNLGFDDAVSLGSQNPNSTVLPFEWGVLPTANRDRINQFFFPTRAPLGTALQSYKDFTFPRIVFP